LDKVDGTDNLASSNVL